MQEFKLTIINQEDTTFTFGWMQISPFANVDTFCHQIYGLLNNYKYYTKNDVKSYYVEFKEVK